MRGFFAVVVGLVLSVGALGSGSAWADKPDHAGGGKGKKEKQGGHQDEQRDDRDGASISIRFGDSERRTVSDYYNGQARAGKCPPGLAKKNNGCQPPGQAKKWSRGKSIGELEVFDLPNDLRVRLPMPPSGHRYVRMGADVLLIAAGTGIVVDAIEDLMR